MSRRLSHAARNEFLDYVAITVGAAGIVALVVWGSWAWLRATLP